MRLGRLLGKGTFGQVFALKVEDSSAFKCVKLVKVELESASREKHEKCIFSEARKKIFPYCVAGGFHVFAFMVPSMSSLLIVVQSFSYVLLWVSNHL